jgi:hypothetical protein
MQKSPLLFIQICIITNNLPLRQLPGAIPQRPECLAVRHGMQLLQVLLKERGVILLVVLGRAAAHGVVILCRKGALQAGVHTLQGTLTIIHVGHALVVMAFRGLWVSLAYHCHKHLHVVARVTHQPSPEPQSFAHSSRWAPRGRGRWVALQRARHRRLPPSVSCRWPPPLPRRRGSHQTTRRGQGSWLAACAAPHCPAAAGSPGAGS